MEPNSQNDNLEDLFRRSFGSGGDGSAGEGWNSPPTEMWGNIRAGIAPAPVPFWQSSRPWKWGSLVAALLLIWLSVQLFGYRSTIEELTEKVNTHEMQMEVLHAELHQSQMYEGQSPYENLSSKDTNENLQFEEEKVLTSVGKGTENRMPKAADSDAENAAQFQVEEVSQKMNQLAETGQYSTLADDKMTSGLFDEISFVALKTKTDLLTKPIVIPAHASKLISPVAQTDIPEAGNGFYLGGTAGSIWITQFQYGNSTYSHNNFYSRNGYAAGVKVGKEIGGKWAVETGLQLTTHYANGTQEHRIKFSRNDEISDQMGGYKSNYRINLTAGSEEIDTEVTFTRPENVQPEEGERIELNFETTEITKYLDVPILTRYEFQSGRLNLAFRMGVLNRLKLSHSFTIDGVEVGDEKFLPSKARHHGHSGRRRSVATDLNTYSFHAVGGLGATYRLSDSWQIGIEPTVTRSLARVGLIEYRGRDNKLAQESFSLNTSLEYRF